MKLKPANADNQRIHLPPAAKFNSHCSKIASVITAALIAQQRSLISAALTCVEQRCCQSAGRQWSLHLLWCLTNEQGYTTLCLYGEGVVQVSIQFAHPNFGVRQAHTGWLIVDLFTARLAHTSLTALAFNFIGNVCSTAGVFRWAPGEKEFSCIGGSHEVPWSRGETWHR